jgi:predicted dehydrogenase
MTPALTEIDLMGPKGRIRADDNSGSRWLSETVEGAVTLDPTFDHAGYPEFFGDALIPAVKEMAQMVLSGAESSSPPERGRDTLEIMLGALLSQDRGNTKVDLPLPRN